MKSVRFVCSFAVFVSTVLLIVLAAAQSSPVAHANQPNVLPNAQNLPAGVATQLTADGQSVRVKFVDGPTYNTGGYLAFCVAAADLNGDGKTDLVVANYYAPDSFEGGGGIGVLLGNGDGTFQAAVSYNAGGTYGAPSVAIGDLNGDGYPDLVVSNNFDNNLGTGAVGILLGNGDGTFQSPVIYSSGGSYAESVVIGDLNGDGHPDIVVANDCPSSNNCSGGSTVSVLLGNGDGTFQPAVSYTSGGLNLFTTENTLAIADLNGDGKLDLVVANSCLSSSNCDGVVSVFLGNGDGTFQAPVSYSSGGYIAGAVVIADVNNDGHLDLVVANACPSSGNCVGVDGVVSVLLGNGDGTFQAPVAYASGALGAGAIAVADLNGDGKLDIAVTTCGGGSCNTVDVLPGIGDGTFESAVTYRTGGYSPRSVAIADVNGDGRPDLLVANEKKGENNDDGTVRVLLNDFTATTTTKVTSSVNPSQVNHSVTFTATVSSISSVPNGSVITFYNGTTKIGTGTTKNGVATLTTSFSKAKTYTIKASYPGDAFHKASSGTVKQVVERAGE